jgi:outer membrane protein
VTRARGATTLAALLFGLCAACATESVNRAPAAADKAWRPPSGDPRDFSLPPAPSLPVQVEDAPKLDADRTYGLPELIDIAESANPDTRIGWQKARQAALAVGIAKAAYLPTIAALALGGYQHTFFPVSAVKDLVIPSPIGGPGLSFPVPPGVSGHVGVDTLNVLPFLAIRWQVLDFGRGAVVDAAEQASVAANVSFSAEHQKVVLEVSKAYFKLGAARAQTALARDALERTRGIARAAEARRARGLATTVEAVEARREVAQGEYNLTQAQASETAVYAALLATMGVDPLQELKIAAGASRELPVQLDLKVDDYLRAALKTRPDLLAAVALHASAKALVSKSESTFLPKLSVEGTAGVAVFGAKIGDGSFDTTTLPNVGASFNFEWLLFDGGIRSAATQIARSRQTEAAETIVKLQHETTHQVVAAYNEVNASLSRYQAATSLETTATVAEDAVTKSYTNGLSTVTDALAAQKARALAAATKEEAFAAALISATSLAYASGQLGSATAVPELKR